MYYTIYNTYIVKIYIKTIINKNMINYNLRGTPYEISKRQYTEFLLPLI